MRFIIIILILFFPMAGEGKDRGGSFKKNFSDLMSEVEFRSLAEELAPKVDLFAKVWEIDSQAQFLGGTTRDYLYWIKAQFKEARTPEQALAVANTLRARQRIEVKEFISAESDIDVISKNLFAIKAEQYAIKKLDRIDSGRFNANTAKGRDEIKQGYIPVEKIRLSWNHFEKPGVFGDGVAEIYRGDLTVCFTGEEDFYSTAFAKEKINHPILLALRYLRLVAQNYYYSHGANLPDKKILIQISPEIEHKIREVIEEAASSNGLLPYLHTDRFRYFFNQTISKAFRSYTNPTAAKMLFDYFLVNKLIDAFPSFIESYNQYVFIARRDKDAIHRTMESFGVDQGQFFTPVSELLGDRMIFHGTKTSPNYRSILFQNVLPSKDGNAGAGLYAVGRSDVAFARKWAGSIDRVVQFEITKDARLVDITQGYGKMIWGHFHRKYPKGDLDRFAEMFGIDVIKYKYEVPAYVVKNAAVLGKPHGYRLRLMPFMELIEEAKKVRNTKDLGAFISMVRRNGIDGSGWLMLARKVLENNPDRILALQFMKLLRDSSPEEMEVQSGLLVDFDNNPDINGKNLERLEGFVMSQIENKPVHWERVIPVLVSRSLIKSKQLQDWINRAVEGGGETSHKYLARCVLSNPKVQKMSGWEKWVGELLQKRWANQEVAQYVFSTTKAIHSEQIGSWIDRILSAHEGIAELCMFVLSRPEVLKRKASMGWILKAAKEKGFVFTKGMAAKVAYFDGGEELLSSLRDQMARSVRASDWRQKYRLQETIYGVLIRKDMVQKHNWTTIVESLFKIGMDFPLILATPAPLEHPQWKELFMKLFELKKSQYHHIYRVLSHRDVKNSRTDWGELLMEAMDRAVDQYGGIARALEGMEDNPYFEKAIDRLLKEGNKYERLAYLFFIDKKIDKHPRWNEWLSELVKQVTGHKGFSRHRPFNTLMKALTRRNWKKHPDRDSLIEQMVIYAPGHACDEFRNSILKGLIKGGHPKARLWQEALSKRSAERRRAVIAGGIRAEQAASCGKSLKKLK